LFLGTQADNIQDAQKKGRLWSGPTKGTHCRRGHPLTEGNTYSTPSGKRRCRTCYLAWQRERRAS
jgi:hypothetical protein